MQTNIQTAASIHCGELAYSYSLFLDLLSGYAEAISIAIFTKMRMQALASAMFSCMVAACELVVVAA